MKIPKTEIQWVGYYDADANLRYVITSKDIRDCYYLYQAVGNGEYEKLGKAKEPDKLIEKYNVMENIHGG